MQLWGFTTGDFAVPSKEDLAAKLALVNAGRISLTEDNGVSSITLPEGMEIDLGGIAKGYTSGRVMEVMKRYGKSVFRIRMIRTVIWEASVSEIKLSSLPVVMSAIL